VNLKRGPELKLPDLSGLRAKLPGRLGSSGPGEGSAASGGGSAAKAPDFLADVYYDLRERRLLPLVALLAVAILAVPFLLGKDSEAPELPAAAPATGGVSSGADGARLTVVESTPGLRDYRKRLHGSPTDPFIQKYTGVPATSRLKSTGEGGEAVSAGGESTISPEAPSSTETGGGSSPASPPASSGGQGGTSPGSGVAGAGGDGDTPSHLFAYRPTIRFGVAGSDQLKLFEEVSLGQLLPEKSPVLVFIGASENGERVAFNLTREVTQVRGPGRCVGGKEECSLLILRAGQAVDLLTDTPGRIFRLQVVKIEFVEVDKGQSASSSDAGGGGSLRGFQNFSK
jgi:hypothetical protein